jgi:hypothetical protein
LDLVRVSLKKVTVLGVTNPEVRMAVTTPQNSKPWKNVEITGYVKVISIKNREKDIPEDVAWFARGGIHNDDARCNGTALIGGMQILPTRSSIAQIVENPRTI